MQKKNYINISNMQNIPLEHLLKLTYIIANDAKCKICIYSIRQ